MGPYNKYYGFRGIRIVVGTITIHITATADAIVATRVIHSIIVIVVVIIIAFEFTGWEWVMLMNMLRIEMIYNTLEIRFYFTVRYAFQ